MPIVPNLEGLNLSQALRAMMGLRGQEYSSFTRKLREKGFPAPTLVVNPWQSRCEAGGALGEGMAGSETTTTLSTSEGMLLAGGFGSVAGVGNFSGAALLNPANGAADVLVFSLVVSAGAAGEVRVGPARSVAGFLTGVNTFAMNAYAGGGVGTFGNSSTTNVTLSTGNNAAAQVAANGTFERQLVLASAPTPLLNGDGEYPLVRLGPGTALVVELEVANTAILGMFKFLIVPIGVYP